MQTPAATRQIPCLVLLTLLLSGWPAAASAVSGWYRYDNGHFIAWSNARERRTRELLGELEGLRAAFIHVSNIEIPADAPIPRVIITRSIRDFEALRPSAGMVGFVVRQSGEAPLMVMPAGAPGALELVRHEYAHILLGHRGQPYPRWYEEGFAELLSATRIIENASAFTFGEPVRRARNHRIAVDWDSIVGDDLNPHRMQTREQASSAYLQAWLLAHYATLGNDMRNARLLQAYFDSLATGMDSLEAFEQAFGARPSELWRSELQAYLRDLPQYVVRLREAALATSFTRSPADPGELEPLLEYLALGQQLGRLSGAPPNALALVDGHWDRLNPAGCDQPLELSWLPGQDRIAVRGSSVAGLPDSTGLAAVPSGPANLTIGDPPSHELIVRSEQLLCIRPLSRPDFNCGQVLRRCPAPG